MARRRNPSLTDGITDFLVEGAKDLASDKVDDIVEVGMEKIDPLLEELLALKEEVAAVRKAVASTKGEITRFKNSMTDKFETIERLLEHADRVFRFLKRIPLVNKFL